MPISLSFHAYGFIIGLSIIVGWWIVEWKAHQRQIAIEQKETIFFTLIIGGLIGARLYHVLSEWLWYLTHPLHIFFIWEGGLSIIGAVIGGVASLLLLKLVYPKILLGTIFDLAAFSLPIAQGLGRFANYFNQELYGWPSSLPWAIYISEEKRLPSLTHFTTFHPLFAYEIVSLLLLSIGLWIWEAKQAVPVNDVSKKTFWRIGRGHYFLLYVLHYSWIRFFLDFLRADVKPPTVLLANILPLRQNQIVLLLVFLFSLGYYVYRRKVNET